MARRDLPHMRTRPQLIEWAGALQRLVPRQGEASRFGYLRSRLIGRPVHGVPSPAGSGPPPTFSASGRAAGLRLRRIARRRQRVPRGRSCAETEAGNPRRSRRPIWHVEIAQAGSYRLEPRIARRVRQRSRDESQDDQRHHHGSRGTRVGIDAAGLDALASRRQTASPSCSTRSAEYPALARRRAPHPLRRRGVWLRLMACGAVSIDEVERVAVAIPTRTNGDAEPEPSAPLPGAPTPEQSAAAAPRSRPRRPRADHRRKASRSPRGTAAGRAAILGALVFAFAAVRLPASPAKSTTPWPARRRGLAAGRTPAGGSSVMGGDRTPEPRTRPRTSWWPIRHGG